jgi:hypothetical protein
MSPGSLTAFVAAAKLTDRRSQTGTVAAPSQKVAKKRM